MMEHRVVIVTGGGTGIGAACVRLLREAGHQVVASGRRPEPLRRLAEETGASPIRPTSVTPTPPRAWSTRP
ncbi:hypothetical protein GCM10017771_38650 [Streptomyces capitiformicae]|uniref:SDR family NAD(P)-dependent oxidoreductase n=1 Tax=Streptomyces capitiformicae TaxID=2014920 RepID=A0A919GSG2_9ACTN|nr:hypothetical protein GCM10017771_38650 [Streptomyces capitiformicae]